MPGVEPATLAGHGTVGPNLLMYLLCVSDLTAFVTKHGDGTRQAQILNVGTTRHDPSLKQRRAVLVRQHGVCATPDATTPTSKSTTPSGGHLAARPTSICSSGCASDATICSTVAHSTSPATPSMDSPSPTGAAKPSASADDEAATAKPPDPKSGGQRDSYDVKQNRVTPIVHAVSVCASTLHTFIPSSDA